MADYDFFPPDQSAPGGVHWNPASPHARLMAKWETTHTQYGPPGRRPYTHQPYPAGMYRASREAQGAVSWDLVLVDDDQQQRNLESRGYALGKGAALAVLEDSEREIATLAANRAFTDRRMSASAQAEAAAADDETAAHLAEIPALPIKRTVKREA